METASWTTDGCLQHLHGDVNWPADGDFSSYFLGEAIQFADELCLTVLASPVKEDISRVLSSHLFQNIISAKKETVECH